MFHERQSGVLLHVSSLPSPYGTGDFGQGVRAFADFLSGAKQRVWQVLPLTPTHSRGLYSPYSGLSAFAGNTLFISPDALREDGLLTTQDLETPPAFSPERADFSASAAYKTILFEKAYARFEKKKKIKKDFQNFCAGQEFWLEDYALFAALRNRFNEKLWSAWEIPLRDRHPDALRDAKDALKNEITKQKFLQFIFFKQWDALKAYCREKNIRIIGDIPIYVDYDSADAWAHAEIFKLDENKNPQFVAGVPPDYFSATGQLWGNPVYRWETLKQSSYDWWIHRITHQLKLFDAVRVDHFRAFCACWEVRAAESTAANGAWNPVPGADFFNALLQKIPSPPILAEDLGVITPDVRELMQRFHFPGMNVLLFAFNGDANNPYLPHHHKEESVVYTGTHDNNTVRGWFEREASHEEKNNFFRYIGHETFVENIHTEFIKLALHSRAVLSVLPAQDVLGLGEEARMNKPATTQNNWTWRVKPEQLTENIMTSLRDMTETSGRV